MPRQANMAPNRNPCSEHPEVGRSFFKYASPETTLKVLESRRFRYSSPLRFNDPSELRAGLHFDFSLDTLGDRLIDRIEALAASNERPPVSPQSFMGQIVLLAWTKYGTHGSPREFLRMQCPDMFVELAKAVKAMQEDYAEQAWRRRLRHIRIFCVSEDCGNELMWSHYAHSHTGAALELRVLPEMANCLGAAKPVSYVRQPVPFCAENELIDDLLSIRELPWSKIHQRYPYYKSANWSYEREWRVWFPGDESDTLDFEDIRISEGELAAIRFGINASTKFIAQATSIASSHFPETRFYCATRSPGSYEISFAPVALRAVPRPAG